MPFSIAYDTVFIHIPKTAGTSMEMLLNMRHPKNLFEYDSLRDNFRQHWPASEVKLHLGEEKYNSMFSFAFVRHPVDRLLSEYHYLQRLGSNFVRGADSNQFIQNIVSLWGNWQAFPRETRQHVRTQTYMLYDNDNNLLVDFVGRFENLKEDWGYVCDKLELPNKLPRSEESANKNNHKEFSPQSIGIIHDLYKEDFKNLNYE